MSDACKHNKVGQDRVNNKWVTRIREATSSLDDQLAAMRMQMQTRIDDLEMLSKISVTDEWKLAVGFVDPSQEDSELQVSDATPKSRLAVPETIQNVRQKSTTDCIRVKPLKLSNADDSLWAMAGPFSTAFLSKVSCSTRGVAS